MALEPDPITQGHHKGGVSLMEGIEQLARTTYSIVEMTQFIKPQAWPLVSYLQNDK